MMGFQFLFAGVQLINLFKKSPKKKFKRTKNSKNKTLELNVTSKE